MATLPWWTLSPSPITLTFYAILGLYGGLKIARIYSHNYKRLRKLAALTDGIFMLGFTVITLDSVWIICSGLRFGWTYPDSVPQLLACLFRNTGLIALCYIFTKDYLQHRATSKTFILYSVNVAFMIVWFALSPSPAYTDWTFALRFDYPLATAAISFVISHIIGKTLVALTYLSYFLKP